MSAGAENDRGEENGEGEEDLVATDGSGAGDRADGERPTWPAVGVVLAVIWLFVNGVPLEPAALAGQFLVGLVLGLPLAYASRRFYWPDTDPWRLLRATPYMALYVVVFVKDVVVANLDVAYRVLAPSMPIEPAVIEVPLRVETDVAVTTIANSITLTPGTLTMDYDDGRNALSVHAIDGRDPAAVVRPIRRWEDYALVIFDERLKPGDPVPELAPVGAGPDEPSTDGGTDRDGRSAAEETDRDGGTEDGGTADRPDEPGTGGGDRDGR